MTKVKMVHNVQCYIYIVNTSSTQSLQIPWDLLMLDYLHTLGWLDLNIDSIYIFSFLNYSEISLQNGCQDPVWSDSM